MNNINSYSPNNYCNFQETAKKSNILIVIQNFTKDEDGVTAIEFALVAPILFYLILVIIEMGVIFTTETNLEFASDNMARAIRTGTLQSDAANIDSSGELRYEVLKQQICANFIFGASACDENLYIDVRSFDDWNSVLLNAIDFTQRSNANFKDNFRQESVPADKVVIIRVYYIWDLLVPGVHGIIGNTGQGFSDIGSGQRVLTSVIALKTEPYASSGAP